MLTEGYELFSAVLKKYLGINVSYYTISLARNIQGNFIET